MKDFFYRLACGVIIGIGCVLPGVSGGIMAISMGLYEKMVGAVSGFFRAVKKNIVFLVPLAIGGVIGILLTSNVLKLVIERYESALLSLFVGLVIGSIPALVYEARGTEKRRFRLRDCAAIFCGLAFVLLFALGEAGVPAHNKGGELNIASALIAGGVLSIGTVLPGVSSSFLLIYIGLYGSVLNALAGIFDLRTLFSEGVAAALSELSEQIVPLIFMTIGFAAIAFLLLLLVNRALKKHHAVSYYAIIGFVAGSIALIAPAIITGFAWYCVPLLFIGVVVSLLQLRSKRRADARAAAAAQPADGGPEAPEIPE